MSPVHPNCQGGRRPCTNASYALGLDVSEPRAASEETEGCRKEGKEGKIEGLYVVYQQLISTWDQQHITALERLEITQLPSRTSRNAEGRSWIWSVHTTSVDYIAHS